jgi:GNAT superfamily N-acetyltransferase
VVRGPVLSFRRARLDDAAALTQVSQAGYATYVEWAPPGWQPPDLAVVTERELTDRLAQPETWGLVAVSGQTPVGYVVLTPARSLEEPRRAVPGLAQLWHLFVVPEWWGRGVATELLASAMAEARRRGCREAFLRTPRDNARSRAFYAREGWHESGATLYAEQLELDLVEYRRMLSP